jgi:hypothetical protein
MMRHLCKCGQEVSRVVIDLGKSSGEEGHEFLSLWRCPTCGDVRECRTVEVCDHCGSEKNLTSRPLRGYEEDYMALVCSDQCLEALEPPPVVLCRGDFQRFSYRAVPARDGRIHRFRCICGELPDGDHWRAEVGDCTAFRCDNCLPSELRN